jgi:hypothetical protein
MSSWAENYLMVLPLPPLSQMTIGKHYSALFEKRRLSQSPPPPAKGLTLRCDHQKNKH